MGVIDRKSKPLKSQYFSLHQKSTQFGKSKKIFRNPTTKQKEEANFGIKNPKFGIKEDEIEIDLPEKERTPERKP